MTRVIVSFIAAALPLCVGCDRAGESPTTSPHGGIRASKIQWKSYFGSVQGEEQHAYVLMAQGFLGIPFLSKPVFADDLDQRIVDWLKAHRKAVVVPIMDIALGDDGGGFRHVWVVDGEENLNHHLVLHGACTSDNMLVPFGLDELLIPKHEYDRFAAAVIIAEKEAMEAKRGVWSLKSYQSTAHRKRADAFEDQGDYEDAIVEFQAIVDKGGDAESAWFRMAKAYEKLEQYDKAITAFDKSLEEKPASPHLNYVGKARCITKASGHEEAVEMIQELIDEHPNDLEPYQILASFHSDEQRSQEAATALEKGITQFLSSHDIRFDENDQFQLEPLRVEDERGYWTHIHMLPTSFANLAQYCISAGDFDRAFKYATMGLSMDQGVKRYLAKQAHHADQYTPEIVEAGDIFCRLARAKVLIHRSSFSEAKAEIDHAKILIDVGSFQGSHLSQELEQAYAELRKASPDQEVVIPPKYVPKRTKVKRPPPIDYAKASNAELIRLADGDDPPVTYAALKELMERDDKARLTPDLLKQLVEDGLRHQADPQRRWSQVYGTFIDRAFARGMLSDAQLSEYATNAPTLGKISVRPVLPYLSLSGDPQLSVSCDVDMRVGYYEYRVGRRDPRPIRLSASIRIIIAKIDGVDVTAFQREPGVPFSTEFDLRPGGTSLLYLIRTDQELKPGKHTHTVTLKIEVRQSPELSRHRAGEEPARPLLAERTMEIKRDFWYTAPTP